MTTALAEAFDRAGIRHPVKRLKDAAESAVRAAGHNHKMAVAEFERALDQDGALWRLLWDNHPGKRADAMMEFLRQVSDGLRKEAGARGQPYGEAQISPARAPANKSVVSMRQREGRAGHYNVDAHDAIAGPSISHATPGMRAANRVAALTILDTHRAPNGLLLGDVTREDLLGYVERCGRDKWFYLAAANGLPPTTTKLRVHKSAEEIQALWDASRKRNDVA